MARRRRLLRGLPPQLERRNPGRSDEVMIGRQQGQLVADAELREQRVNRSDLQSAPPAGIAQLRCRDMIVPVRSEERERREALDDQPASLGSGKALEQFLQHQAGRDDRITALERVDEGRDLGAFVRRITPQRQRPDAGIDEQTQDRERSAL